MRTFIWSPSRDLMVNSEPSTASMVPRMRTGGGCWAHATDPSTVMAIIEAIRRVSKEDIFMVSPYPEFRDNSKTPQRGGYSTASVRRRGRVIPALHRRRQPVAANADAVGLERTVRQQFHEGDHLGAGFQVGLVGGGVGP